MKLVPEIPGGEVTQEQIDSANKALWQSYCAEVGGPKCDKNPPKGGKADQVQPQQEGRPEQFQGDGKPLQPSCFKPQKGDTAIPKCFPPLKILED
jgi:hypothetical protein